MASSTALLTDMYELTMLRSAIADGTADKQAAFEVFARSLKDGNRYGVFAGLGRILDAIEDFTFDTDTLDWMTAEGIIDGPTRDWLTDWTFTGRITAYREGELYFRNSPVITVEGRFGDAILLETIILSIVNHDSAIATKAARIRAAAGERTVIEMGSRRTHEHAAVAAARATAIAGFDATSNLHAAAQYGLRAVGTAAHAWTLAHRTEAETFDAQITALGVDTTLLIDTYDIEQGTHEAIAAARRAGANGPGAVRIDSGDLALESKRVRRILDDAGATGTRIVVSGDLDEHAIAALADAPIDGYGIGTKVVTGLTAPGFVYKLVEIADPTYGTRPVSKESEGKRTVGGRKRTWREITATGHAAIEHVAVPLAKPTRQCLGGTLRELQTVVWDCQRTDHSGVAEARTNNQAALDELPTDVLAPHQGTAAILTVIHEKG